MYYIVVYEKSTNQIEIPVIAALGIEANVYKGLFIKGEYRQENYEHRVLAGIGYIFGTYKK